MSKVDYRNKVLPIFLLSRYCVFIFTVGIVDFTT